MGVCNKYTLFDKLIHENVGQSNFETHCYAMEMDIYKLTRIYIHTHSLLLHEKVAYISIAKAWIQK